MPSQTGNATVIRSERHSTRVYASFYAPAPIITAEISAAPLAFPVFYLVVNILTGDWTEMRPGFRVDVLTPGGALKGRTRLRFGNTLTDTVFHIRETADAKMNVELGDLVYVYPELRLSDKLVEANELFSPDGTPYTDQGSNPPPWVNSGGAWAGDVDDGETFASVAFTHSTSFNVDPDSGSTINHLTTFPSGVALAAGDLATDADLVLEVDVGQYLITHEAEDDDNGKTSFKCTPVIVHDADTPPHDVIVTAYDGTPDDGFNWSIEVVNGDTSLETIPDGCLCILWTRERVGGAWASYRNAAPGRSHILGVGYVSRDTTRAGEDGVAVTSFEVISPQARLKQITAYSKVMEESASPTTWAMVKTLAVKRADIQFKMFYTTLNESPHDMIYDSALINPRYPAFYLQRSSIYDMGVELLTGVDARMTCDRSGRFSVHTAPYFIPLADRAAITKTWRFARNDVLSWEINRIHYDVVEILKVSGITGGVSGNTDLYSRYPGEAPGEGVEAQSRDKLIVTDQSDMNERAGRYGAFFDDVFVDANGVRYRAFELRMTLRGSYDFFDFGKEFSDFTESLRDLLRADVTDFLFYPTSTSTVFESGASSSDVVFRVATNAPAGTTYVPPADATGSTGYEQPPVFRPGSLTNGNPFTLNFGSGRIGFVGSDGYLYYTTTFNSAEPVWARLNLSMNGTAQDFVTNPFSPRYLTGTGSVELWVVTSNRVYFVEWDPDAPTTATVTSQFTFVTPSAGFSTIETERAFEGVVGVVRSFSGVATDYHGTTDGTNWTITTTLNADGGAVPSLFVSPNVSGRIITSTIVTGGGAVIGKISSNNGTSFASIASPDISGAQGIGGLHFPFNGNAAESECYYGTFVAGVRFFYRVNGLTKTDITPDADHWAAARRSIDTCPINRNYLAVVVSDASDNHVYASPNQGASWTLVDDSNAYLSVFYSGSDIQHFYMCGLSGAIGVGSQAGVVESRMGNIATLGTPTVLRIFGF